MALARADRFSMKKSVVRHLGLPVIVTVAAISALTATTADVAARERASFEAAPRDEVPADVELLEPVVSETT